MKSAGGALLDSIRVCYACCHPASASKNTHSPPQAFDDETSLGLLRAGLQRHRSYSAGDVTDATAAGVLHLPAGTPSAQIRLSTASNPGPGNSLRNSEDTSGFEANPAAYNTIGHAPGSRPTILKNGAGNAFQSNATPQRFEVNFAQASAGDVCGAAGAPFSAGHGRRHDGQGETAATPFGAGGAAAPPLPPLCLSRLTSGGSVVSNAHSASGINLQALLPSSLSSTSSATPKPMASRPGHGHSAGPVSQHQQQQSGPVMVTGAAADALMAGMGMMNMLPSAPSSSNLYGGLGDGGGDSSGRATPGHGMTSSASQRQLASAMNQHQQQQPGWTPPQYHHQLQQVQQRTGPSLHSNASRHSYADQMQQQLHHQQQQQHFGVGGGSVSSSRRHSGVGAHSGGAAYASGMAAAPGGANGGMGLGVGMGMDAATSALAAGLLGLNVHHSSSSMHLSSGGGVGGMMGDGGDEMTGVMGNVGMGSGMHVQRSSSSVGSHRSICYNIYSPLSRSQNQLQFQQQQQQQYHHHQQQQLHAASQTQASDGAEGAFAFSVQSGPQSQAASACVSRRASCGLLPASLASVNGFYGGAGDAGVSASAATGALPGTRMGHVAPFSTATTVLPSPSSASSSSSAFNAKGTAQTGYASTMNVNGDGQEMTGIGILLPSPIIAPAAASASDAGFATSTLNQPASSASAAVPVPMPTLGRPHSFLEVEIPAGGSLELSSPMAAGAHPGSSVGGRDTAPVSVSASGAGGGSSRAAASATANTALSPGGTRCVMTTNTGGAGGSYPALPSPTSPSPGAWTPRASSDTDGDDADVSDGGGGGGRRDSRREPIEERRNSSGGGHRRGAVVSSKLMHNEDICHESRDSRASPSDSDDGWQPREQNRNQNDDGGAGGVGGYRAVSTIGMRLAMPPPLSLQLTEQCAEAAAGPDGQQQANQPKVSPSSSGKFAAAVQRVSPLATVSAAQDGTAAAASSEVAVSAVVDTHAACAGAHPQQLQQQPGPAFVRQAPRLHINSTETISNVMMPAHPTCSGLLSATSAGATSDPQRMEMSRSASECTHQSVISPRYGFNTVAVVSPAIADAADSSTGSGHINSNGGNGRDTDDVTSVGHLRVLSSNSASAAALAVASAGASFVAAGEADGTTTPTAAVPVSTGPNLGSTMSIGGLLPVSRTISAGPVLMLHASTSSSAATLQQQQHQQYIAQAQVQFNARQQQLQVQQMQQQQQQMNLHRSASNVSLQAAQLQLRVSTQQQPQWQQGPAQPQQFQYVDGSYSPMPNATHGARLAAAAASSSSSGGRAQATVGGVGGSVSTTNGGMPRPLDLHITAPQYEPGPQFHLHHSASTTSINGGQQTPGWYQRQQHLQAQQQAMQNVQQMHTPFVPRQQQQQFAVKDTWQLNTPLDVPLTSNSQMHRSSSTAAFDLQHQQQLQYQQQLQQHQADFDDPWRSFRTGPASATHASRAASFTTFNNGHSGTNNGVAMAPFQSGNNQQVGNQFNGSSMAGVDGGNSSSRNGMMHRAHGSSANLVNVSTPRNGGSGGMTGIGIYTSSGTNPGNAGLYGGWGSSSNIPVSANTPRALRASTASAPYSRGGGNTGVAPYTPRHRDSYGQAHGGTSEYYYASGMHTSFGSGNSSNSGFVVGGGAISPTAAGQLHRSATSPLLTNMAPLDSPSHAHFGGPSAGGGGGSSRRGLGLGNGTGMMDLSNLKEPQGSTVSGKNGLISSPQAAATAAATAEAIKSHGGLNPTQTRQCINCKSTFIERDADSKYYRADDDPLGPAGATCSRDCLATYAFNTGRPGLMSQ